MSQGLWGFEGSALYFSWAFGAPVTLVRGASSFVC